MNRKALERSLEKTERQFNLVLTALQERNFEKAASLVPEGYKLCGYQKFIEPFTYERHGYNWGDQFEVTEIAPGLYPVFVKEYYYNEKDEVFTNQVKDYPGLCFWYKGLLTSSSEIHYDKPYMHTLMDFPYAHSVAKDILFNNSKVTLLPPFDAVEVPFKHQGENLVTYHIIDTSLPLQMENNPFNIKNSFTTPSLDEKLKSFQEQAKAQPYSPKNQEKKDFRER